ncbi:hypothetical protein LWI29_020857 [Acer saccharum]|uniref:Uncharacterized protein n=1 Tax=Acer saccharum TaxID=4024 RepID=A0AA39RQ89_ACESA|nr:hypothetical protein LWI29_020857 [Acer saccharum]
MKNPKFACFGTCEEEEEEDGLRLTKDEDEGNMGSTLQQDDVIKLYFRATYLYRVEEFNCEMAELKATHRKVYDELLEVGVEKFSRVHSPRKRYHMMITNIA